MAIRKVNDLKGFSIVGHETRFVPGEVSYVIDGDEPCVVYVFGNHHGNEPDWGLIMYVIFRAQKIIKKIKKTCYIRIGFDITLFARTFIILDWTKVQIEEFERKLDLVGGTALNSEQVKSLPAADKEYLWKMVDFIFENDSRLISFTFGYPHPTIQ